MRPERPATPAITGPAQADAFADAFVATMALLERVIEDETTLLKQSRLREAGGLAQAKTDASRNYVLGLEALRNNAVALARWTPAGVARLKAGQASLSDALAVNMAVLATARSVSESIVRSLAHEVAAPHTLTTYGAGGRASGAGRQTAMPLVLSKSL
jgi:hypothetical protein